MKLKQLLKEIATSNSGMRLDLTPLDPELKGASVYKIITDGLLSDFRNPHIEVSFKFSDEKPNHIGEYEFRKGGQTYLYINNVSKELEFATHTPNTYPNIPYMKKEMRDIIRNKYLIKLKPTSGYGEIAFVIHGCAIPVYINGYLISDMNLRGLYHKYKEDGDPLEEIKVNNPVGITLREISTPDSVFDIYEMTLGSGENLGEWQGIAIGRGDAMVAKRINQYTRNKIIPLLENMGIIYIIKSNTIGIFLKGDNEDKIQFI